VRAAQVEVERASSRLASATVAGSVASPTVTFRDPVASASAAAGARAPAVAHRAAAPRAEASSVVALETEWVKLTRGVTEAREHQDQVEAALFKANIAASSESGGHGVQVTTIDPAFLPQNPVPPGRTAVAAIFMAVSLLFGALGAVVRAVLDDRVYDGRDASRLLTVLVEVPRHSSRRARVAG
jgi:uncharacterized protein involved in exopolysaccharide biosynthesis